MRVKLVLGCLLLACAAAPPGRAQEPLAQLSRDLLPQIAASGKNRILIDAKFECPGKCDGLHRYFPARITEELLRSSTSLELVTPEQVAPLLREGGFQPIDIHFSEGLRWAANRLDVLFLTGSLKLRRDRVEVEVQLHRGSDSKIFYKKKIAVARPADPPAQAPLCDPGTNVCVSGFGGVSEPECVACPNPKFNWRSTKSVPGAIQLLVTVTSEGSAADLKVTQGLDSGLDETALATLATWRFKPARDSSGTPVASRVQIEITIRWY